MIIAVVSQHYYHVRKGAIEKDLEYRMQNSANDIARQIVSVHMQGGSLETLLPTLNKNGFLLGLFAFDDQPLFSELDLPKKTPKGFSKMSDRYYLLHDGTFDHLDVHYLILESSGIQTELEILQHKIILGAGAIVLIISIMAIFLSRLFLRPLRNEIKRIDQFVKNSTHELNTPIAALLMSVKSLQKEQPASKKLQRIEISARRISDIYKDLTFLLLKPDQQRMDETVPLDALLLEQIDYFTPLADSKQITMESEVEKVQLQMEPERATLLLDNLISNAIKYSPVGGTIRLNLTKRQLNVEDQGPGIPSDQHQAIFNRYTRLDQTKGGFGIGLHIVKTICDEYGFIIEIKNNPQGGSRFMIRFF